MGRALHCAAGTHYPNKVIATHPRPLLLHCSPCGPCNPCVPYHCGPCGPCVPCQPYDPCCPCSPAALAGPAALAAPEAPAPNESDNRAKWIKPRTKTNCRAKWIKQLRQDTRFAPLLRASVTDTAMCLCTTAGLISLRRRTAARGRASGWFSRHSGLQAAGGCAAREGRLQKVRGCILLGLQELASRGCRRQEVSTARGCRQQEVAPHMDVCRLLGVPRTRIQATGGPATSKDDQKTWVVDIHSCFDRVRDAPTDELINCGLRCAAGTHQLLSALGCRNSPTAVLCAATHHLCCAAGTHQLHCSALWELTNCNALRCNSLSALRCGNSHAALRCLTSCAALRELTSCAALRALTSCAALRELTSCAA
eukprot:gene8306-biopygen16618